MDKKTLPKVSVIITTKNSAGTLGRLLESVKNQSYENIEIIVVDNNSGDSTPQTARKYTKKVYNFGPERSAQRNFGAKKARGQYLLVLDSDMILTKNVVAECVREVSQNQDTAEVAIPERSYGSGIWAKAKSLEREINEGEPYFESARFFKKKIFWELGGYDETLTGPEDWDLPQSISKKYRVGRIKSKILHNEGRPTPFGLARRKFYYGLSAHRYLRKQRLPILSPATVYFLRPAFYRNWRKLFQNPSVSLAMFLMLFFETIGGSLGYLVGRFRK